MSRTEEVELNEIPISPIDRPRLVVPITAVPAELVPVYEDGDLGDRITEHAICATPGASSRGIKALALCDGPELLQAPKRLARILDSHGTIEALDKAVALPTSDYTANDVREAAEVIKEASATLKGHSSVSAGDIPTRFFATAEANVLLQTLVPRFFDPGVAMHAQILEAEQTLGALLALPEAKLVSEFREAASRQASIARARLESDADAIAAEVSPETRAGIAAAQVASVNARGALVQPLVVFVRGSQADLLRNPDLLLDALRADDALGHDLLLPAPFAAFGQLTPLLDGIVGKATTVWATPRAGNGDALLAMGRQHPPSADRLGGHLAIFAGGFKHRGLPVVSAAAAVGLRHSLDAICRPDEGLYGMAEPQFGLHRGPDKVILGADDASVTTARWPENTGFALAKLGINIWWNDLQLTTPLLERSRTTLEGREQIWAARLTRVVSSLFRRELRKLSGSVNPKHRELFIDRVVAEGLGPYRQMEHFRVWAKKLVTGTTRTTEVKVDVGVNEATERTIVYTKIRRGIDVPI